MNETARDDGPVLTERARVRAIRTICRGEYPQIEAQAIDDGWSEDQTRSAVLDALRSSRATVNVVAGSADVPSRAVLEAALLARAGRADLVAKSFEPRVVAAARALRSPSLIDICAMCLRMDGREVTGLSRSEIVATGFSTVSLPNIMQQRHHASTALMRTPRARLGGACSVAWSVRPTSSSRPPCDRARSEPSKSWGRLVKSGHMQLGEAVLLGSLGTFARQLRLTREMVINDDLNIFDQMAPMLGRMGGRALNDVVYTTLLSGAGAHFTAGCGNLLTTGSDLDAESLGEAIALLRKQRDPSGADIQITPKVLLVPPELEMTAKALVASTYVGVTDGSPTGKVVVESRLSNPAFSGFSATAWYLFAGPIDAPMLIGFLEGREAPTVESFGLSSDVDTLGFSWRVYHDFGASLGDYRAGIRATGAAT
jgi:hypothetical protein